MAKRILYVGAVVFFAVASFAARSEATTITFDAAISGVLAPDDPGDPFDNCVAFCAYDPTAGNEGIFATQGYTFTALTNTGAGDHGLGIVVDPSLVPGVADNGTDWLLTGGIVQMVRTDSAAFSLLSFQAAQVDPSDAFAGDFIRVLAFKSGIFFQGLQFDLTAASGFQTFALPSTWTDLSSVNFSGRLPTDGVNGFAFPRIAGVDNIEVTAVPEPGSLLLFGTGLLALARSRFKRFKTRA